MVSAADPVCALLVLAKLALLVPLMLFTQQLGKPALLGSAVSSEGLTTPLVPAGAGGTVGALTGGLTDPPITWPTVWTGSG